MNRNAESWVPVFPEDDISFILSSEVRCSAALQKKHDTEREDHISNRLRQLIRHDAEFRKLSFTVDREALVFDDDSDSAEPIGRIDFRFCNARHQTDNEWHFVIEAKRLHVTFPSGWQSLVSEYVTGHQGMMCFIDQRYARGLLVGAMLGYVFDGKIEKARKSVAAAIETNRDHLKCASRFSSTPPRIFSGPSSVSESRHTLPHGIFKIYHLFIAV